MKSFLSIEDVSDLDQLLKTAADLKKDPLKFRYLGKNRSVCLIFLNPSLRTRLSSERAAANLGMDAVFLDIGGQGWKLEFADGVVMNADKAEHIREAAAVIGSYYDYVGIRAFAELEDFEKDYSEEILTALHKYCPVPVINLESSTAHPLQALADLITIEKHKKTAKPRVVLTWAPHPKALPQAVANSFSRWTQRAGYDLVITHPKGYELTGKVNGNAKIEYDQKKAFENADFIYAKNWSSVSSYGQVLSQDPSWMIDEAKMNHTNNAYFMHCLPVRRNMIVSDQVIDNKNSLVIEQAKNRVVSMQTVLRTMLEQKDEESEGY
ncbi:N-acetylornithine carbamoyltransferase [Balneola sp. MJW-20]|uniref:N-acetylornithine carbamoyltransferase n=1 Tax=Gracilimonas aurantiaca TaxID=3234185 RepID=UPI003466EF11